MSKRQSKADEPRSGKFDYEGEETVVNFDKYKTPQDRVPDFGELQTKFIQSDNKQRAAPVKFKFSSTNTVFLRSTITAQDTGVSLRSVSLAIFFHLHNKNRDPAKDKILEAAFSESICPLDKSWNQPVIQKPAVSTIYKCLKSAYTAAQLDPEAIIITLIYVERLISMTGGTLGPTTWRPICLCALILAAKVWNDLAVWNVDFQSAYPRVNKALLNKMEVKFLGLAKYNLVVSAAHYARYYFELRALADVTQAALKTRESNYTAKDIGMDKARNLTAPIAVAKPKPEPST
eukprot:TRINITY_DN2193_c0_g1_i1.p1 TRINITY_DN2193_c0_g1~~TRINITY_DN2193_c0_g1_i1.p1  ORF type:complete len:290 (-),score=58.55 TRINITY_DN2193_c0_g1_i1:330-1199(-)